MKIDKKQLKIAKNYAKALFDITQNRAERLNEELHSLLEILHNSNDLKEFLENPLISVSDKKEVIFKVFGKDFDLQIINLLNMLADNKRLSFIETVCYCFEKLYEETNSISKVEVCSAVEMKEETKNRLVEVLQRKLNCKVIPTYCVKEDILGGLVIKINDKIIDLSLSSKIKDMGKILIKG